MILKRELDQTLYHSGSRLAGAHRRGPADFFSKIHIKQVCNYFWKPNSTEIYSNYSIRRWSFLIFLIWILISSGPYRELLYIIPVGSPCRELLWIMPTGILINSLAYYYSVLNAKSSFYVLLWFPVTKKLPHINLKSDLIQVFPILEILQIPMQLLV
jgi:hypothetical protein